MEFASTGTTTFKVPKASTSTYTASDGRTVSVTITIEVARETTKPGTSGAIAGTGDSSKLWLYVVVAVYGIASIVLYRKRQPVLQGRFV